jgi:cytoskeletal protein CcmA (bactofilin family)
MLNSKDGFFGKRDDKVRKDVGSIYGMNSSSSSTSSVSSSPSVVSTTPTSEIKTRTETAAVSASEETKGNKLIVGPDIKLKGEINDCDTIIVEGRVEATTDTKMLQIAESGSFDGTVGMDVAEIRGKFQGELTARQKLVIYATGSVSGKIRYGKIIIEEGGELSGDVSSLATAKQAGSSTTSKDSDDSKSSDFWRDQEAKKAGGKAASA